MKKLKKWKVVRSSYVKKSPWVNWRIDTCRLPNGKQIEDFHVSEIPVGVGIVALTPEQEIILVRQYRHGTRKILLEIPGGTVGAEDRTPLHAARRELREETGYSSRRWFLLGKLFLYPASQENLVFIYLALDIKRTSNQQLDQSEDIEVKLVSFDRVLQMIRSRRIQSLGSTAGILLAREKIRA